MIEREGRLICILHNDMWLDDNMVHKADAHQMRDAIIESNPAFERKPEESRGEYVRRLRSLARVGGYQVSRDTGARYIKPPPAAIPATGLSNIEERVEDAMSQWDERVAILEADGIETDLAMRIAVEGVLRAHLKGS